MAESSGKPNRPQKTDGQSGAGLLDVSLSGVLALDAASAVPALQLILPTT
jgi:hypothetical protein